MIFGCKKSSLIMLCLIVLLFFSSCSEEEDYLSVDEANEKFNAAIHKSNYCDVGDDCIVFGAECPLDCWYYISKEEESEIQNKHDSIIEEYEKGKSSCSYECIEPFAATCVNNVCRGN